MGLPAQEEENPFFNYGYFAERLALLPYHKMQVGLFTGAGGLGLQSAAACWGSAYTGSTCKTLPARLIDMYGYHFDGRPLKPGNPPGQGPPPQNGREWGHRMPECSAAGPPTRRSPRLHMCSWSKDFLASEATLPFNARGVEHVTMTPDTRVCARVPTCGHASEPAISRLRASCCASASSLASNTM